jgi:hypothetical protein
MRFLHHYVSKDFEKWNTDKASPGKRWGLLIGFSLGEIHRAVKILSTLYEELMGE